MLPSKATFVSLKGLVDYMKPVLSETKFKLIEEHTYYTINIPTKRRLRSKKSSITDSTYVNSNLEAIEAEGSLLQWIQQKVTKVIQKLFLNTDDQLGV